MNFPNNYEDNDLETINIQCYHFFEKKKTCQHKQQRRYLDTKNTEWLSKNAVSIKVFILRFYLVLFIIFSVTNGVSKEQ